MTKEEIITKVWKHFVLDKNLPGRLGADDFRDAGPPRCVAMCAVGVLVDKVSDREALDEVTLQSANALSRLKAGGRCSEEALELVHEHRPLLCRLQTTHDAASSRTMMRSRKYSNGFCLDLFRRYYMLLLLVVAAEHNVTLYWADGRPVE